MKADKIKIYVSEITLLIILSFALFVPNIFNKTMILFLLTIYAIIVNYIIKKRKTDSVNSKKVILLMILLAVIYLISYYLLGLYFGYNETTYKIGINTIVNYIIPMAVIIISTETMRKIYIMQNERNITILAFIICVLIDILIYKNIYNLLENKDIVEKISFILATSVAYNLLYIYITKRYDIKANIYYKLITILYIYIIPYIPNINMFFYSVLNIIYPYIIYQVLEYTFTKDNMVIALTDKRKRIVSTGIIFTLAIILVMLISCQFKYGLIVVGSGSMTGVVNKGDMAFIERYDSKNDEINVGQIIVFKKNDIKIIHRVIEKIQSDGETKYITKGDVNPKRDEGYITDDDILAIYKYRIAYIGYPSIWLNETFNK